MFAGEIIRRMSGIPVVAIVVFIEKPAFPPARKKAAPPSGAAQKRGRKS
jgi:hypothetical protein